jgi:predicted nuclease of predicted toxin-antitoxin system
MNLLADESVSGAILDRLRADGYAVESVRAAAPGGADEDVLARANRADTLLLTEDKDFGELVYRRQLPHVGVVLIRFDGLSRQRRTELASVAFRDHAAEFAGAFTVITPAGIRIRKPPTSDSTTP